MLQWHTRVGLLVLFLLVFRLCWGIWGSDTARFSRFVRGWAGIRGYLKNGIPEHIQPGHNPLGALMVVALLAAVSFQVGTGLFAADENTFSTNGYLNHLVSEHTGSLIRKIHLNFFKLLAVFSAVHIAAVAAYRIFKKKNLVRPMITGFKYIEGKTSIRFAGKAALAAALSVAALAAAAILLLS
ncbi:nickel-dependent hydrogenase b-type cytochrome subunit [Neisseria gonorrhoeae]